MKNVLKSTRPMTHKRQPFIKTKYTGALPLYLSPKNKDAECNLDIIIMSDEIAKEATGNTEDESGG